MTAYQYEVRDLRTNERLGVVPLGDVRITRNLENGFEEFSATLDMAKRDSDGQRLGNQYREMLRSGRCKIIPLRGEDKDPRAGAYIVWSRQYLGGRSLTLTGAGMLSYFTGDFGPDLTTTKTYSVATDDQFDIVRDLLATAQMGAGNIGLQVTATDSGVKRDQTYPGYEQNKIGDLILNLAARENGFDITLETAGSPPITTLRLHYPRAGRRASASGLVFTLGRNLRSFSLNEGPPTTTMRAVGIGEAVDMLRRSASRSDLLTAGWPTLVQSRSYKTVSVANTLQSHATADLRLANAEALQYTLDLIDPNDPSVPYGQWVLGDEAKIVIPPDIDNYYPDGFETELRIVGQTLVVPNEGGPEQISLLMGPTI